MCFRSLVCVVFRLGLLMAYLLSHCCFMFLLFCRLAGLVLSSFWDGPIFPLFMSFLVSCESVPLFKKFSLRFLCKRKNSHKSRRVSLIGCSFFVGHEWKMISLVRCWWVCWRGTRMNRFPSPNQIKTESTWRQQGRQHDNPVSGAVVLMPPSPFRFSFVFMAFNRQDRIHFLVTKEGLITGTRYCTRYEVLW